MSVETYQAILPGAEVYSSDNALSLVRPVLYPQCQYESPQSIDAEKRRCIPDLQSLLMALHVATNGAFYEIPIGSQALPIVQNVRTIETFAAPKKGGIFDSRKVRDAGQSITNHEHPYTPIAFEPRMSDGGPLELERKNGGYLVWLVFEENEEHSESIKRMAGHIGQYVTDVCRKKLHEVDELAFEMATGLGSLRMCVGIIEKDQLEDDLLEVANDDPSYFYEAAEKRYRYMSEDGLLGAGAPGVMLPKEAEIWFGALSLVYANRKSKLR